jgi:hypothetical protein
MLSSKLQVPLPLLLNDGTSTNKSTVDAEMAFMSDQLIADENIMKQVIEEQIFAVACKLKYGENIESSDIPNFFFNPYIDAFEEINLAKEKVLVAKEYTAIAKDMQILGKPELVELMMDELTKLYENSSVKKTNKIEDIKNTENEIKKVEEKKKEEISSIDENNDETLLNKEKVYK